MNRGYWDRLARQFDKEVFDTTACDKNRTILKAIVRHADPAATACDLGCGVGRWVPALAAHFREVVAVDFSPGCLEVARKKHRDITNVRYVCADVTNPRARIPATDFVVSINVVMMPDARRRARALALLRKKVKPGGRVLMVVPSLESALLAGFRLRRWRGQSAGPTRSRRGENPSQGLVAAGGTITKHFLREELDVLLEDAGFTDVTIRKVEYGWDTEFEDPPKWMRRPYPWDWLILCRPA
jgi:ubiquinone/menaquinone biosynthesis C-methylase UbiE